MCCILAQQAIVGVHTVCCPTNEPTPYRVLCSLFGRWDKLGVSRRTSILKKNQTEYSNRVTVSPWNQQMLETHTYTVHSSCRTQGFGIHRETHAVFEQKYPSSFKLLVDSLWHNLRRPQFTASDRAHLQIWPIHSVI